MSTATSQIQKHFQMHNVYKRSRRYYDVQKLKSEQHFEEINRRKPNQSIETLDTRVDESFFNAAQVITKRMENQITQIKKRSHQQTQAYTNAEKSIYRSNVDFNDFQIQQRVVKKLKLKIKAPDLEKMLGRQTFSDNKTFYNNQDQFNNFLLTNNKSRAQINFQLNTARPKQLIENPQNQKLSSSDTGHTKQKLHFNTSVFKCLFEYNKIDKYRHLSKKKSERDESPPMIDQAKLNQASKSAKVRLNPMQNQFYLSIGRQFPRQMDSRYNRPIENYFDKKGERESKEDYIAKKKRKQMMELRLKGILKKKQVKDDRGQMCDEKYFNREQYRRQRVN